MSNPFDLRFSMIIEAKNLLTEEWHSETNTLKEKYFADRDAGLDVSFPVLPKFPSFEEIEKLANEMNSFVSNR